MSLADHTERMENLVYSGHCGEALKLGKTVLREYPKDPKLFYLLGLCELNLGNNVEAIDWLGASLTERVDSAACANNLALAYQGIYQFDEALRYFDHAIAMDGTLISARYNRGVLQFKSGRLRLAGKDFKWLVEHDNTNPRYLCGLADVTRALENYPAAIKLYQRVLAEKPSFERAVKNLCIILLASNDTEQVIHICQKAIADDSSLFVAHRYLGDSFSLEENFDAAMEAYADAFDLKNEDADLNLAIANMWLRAGEFPEAASWFSATIALDEENVVAQCGLIQVMKETGSTEQALAKCKALYEAHPEDETVLMTLSDLTWEEGDADEAMSYLNKLNQLKPQAIGQRIKAAQILASSGQVLKAVSYYEDILEKTPTCIPALSGIATSLKKRTETKHITVMHRLLEKSQLPEAAQAQLCSGLAHYYDGIGDYAEAARLSTLANKHQWSVQSKIKWHYEPAEYEKRITDTIETFNAAYFDRIKQADFGLVDERPVFIVAMPRSGTTLMEQILAKHPNVLGVGERKFVATSFRRAVSVLEHQEESGYAGVQQRAQTLNRLDKYLVQEIGQDYLVSLKKLTEQAGKENVRRIVDKLPDNYSLIGWILTLFPKARIIHCQRDPRDVALSCWLTQFGEITWACRPEHLVTRIQQYQRIMNHWRLVIPDRFLEVSYQDIVNNQEIVSRKLINYLGLPWDQACLSFYDSDRLIRTASVTQVRKPVYKSSLNKWRHYQAFLPELVDVLDPSA